MARIRPPRKVKFFVGMLAGDRDLLRLALQLLSRCFGEVDIESAFYPFDHTTYYSPELGDAVERQFLSFAPLINPEALVDIKRESAEQESRLALDVGLPAGQRCVNLDPGYLSLSKVVLATTKDYSHRIYLQRGIYAEVTLRYLDGGWHSWPWTYPDYAAGHYHDFFMKMRRQLKRQLAEPTEGR